MTKTWNERAAEVARRSAPDDGTTMFVFEGQKFRTVRLDGEPWFVLADVCKVLGMTNPSYVKTRLNSEDTSTLSSTEGGGARTIINESGLYDVILDSRKPQAKSFRRWITSEVIPSIRKTGGYTAPGVAQPAKPELPQDYLSALKELVEVTEKAIVSEQVAKAAIKERNQVSAELEQAAPKVKSYDEYMDAGGTCTLTEAAKILGWRPRVFNDELRSRGILYKRNDSNLPIQEYLNRGWFTVIAVKYHRPGKGWGSNKQTRVTPKGVDELSRRLGNDHGLVGSERARVGTDGTSSRFSNAPTFGGILAGLRVDWFDAIERLEAAGVTRGNYVQPMYRNYFIWDVSNPQWALSKRVVVSDQGKKFLVDLLGPSVPDFSNVRSIF